MSVGVIVAVDAGTTRDQIAGLIRALEERFPGVVFAIGAGVTSSVAFEWTPPAKGYPELKPPWSAA